MQFINLSEQYKQIKTIVDNKIQTVLDHGQYILGPEVAELEAELAKFVGVEHCITVANGTDALMIALMALDIKPGDEVITTPFTFIANAEMIALLGATPIFVDIDSETYNIDATKISAAVTKKTKCIMPISLYGQCANIKAINAIASEFGIPVIEDAAQSFGATHYGVNSCGLSTIGCTSFFPTKPLGCYGDGGALFTNNAELANTIKQIHVHGQIERYRHGRLGMNSRLDTIQAAILLAKLAIFPAEIKSRQRIANRYNLLLKDHVKILQVNSENTCVWAQYTIAVQNRSSVQQNLKTRGIPTAIHYPLPIHKQPIFATTPHLDLVNAEHAANTVISLPMHPYLSEDQQDFIVKNLIESLETIEKVN